MITHIDDAPQDNQVVGIAYMGARLKKVRDRAGEVVLTTRLTELRNASKAQTTSPRSAAHRLSNHNCALSTPVAQSEG